jgi:hypothetical protein
MTGRKKIIIFASLFILFCSFTSNINCGGGGSIRSSFIAPVYSVFSGICPLPFQNTFCDTDDIPIIGRGPVPCIGYSGTPTNQYPCCPGLVKKKLTWADFKARCWYP